MLSTISIPEMLQQQRQFFATGKTQDLNFRLEQLKRLKSAIQTYEADIFEALGTDFRKPSFESYLAEVRATTEEINYTLKHLKSWVKPRRAAVSIAQIPASAFIRPEPKGVVLIIGPWNYPFYLILAPLVGAIAAGNSAILKPSEMTPATSGLIARLVAQTFDPAYISVIEGGVETSQQLLAQKFDHIFFTGGTAVGKIIMEAAAKHLTPVTLELGGKSPCIVDNEIDLRETAKRITWGKFLNAGQTCVAPDYLLVNRQIKSPLLESLKQSIGEFYGENPEKSPDYARIVNDRHFQRLSQFLKEGEIAIGGETNATERYIAPTLTVNVPPASPLMQEEIFGPILPIMEYETLEEAISFIKNRPKPLSLYFFSKNASKQQQVLANTSSGGVCLNDTIMHLGVTELPFGGVGDSGMGAYHGKTSFDTFTHYKSVLKRPFWGETNLRYPPYKSKLGWVKRLLG